MTHWKFLNPELLFEEYYSINYKPDEIIIGPKKKLTIQQSIKSARILIQDLEEELEEVVLRSTVLDEKPLDIYNCYKNPDYHWITDEILSIQNSINSKYKKEDEPYIGKPIEEWEREARQKYYNNHIERIYHKRTGISIREEFYNYKTLEKNTWRKLYEHHAKHWKPIWRKLEPELQHIRGTLEPKGPTTRRYEQLGYITNKSGTDGISGQTINFTRPSALT